MNKSRSETGFTIVELLVATAIFSTIMLVMTFAIMQFSRSYYRGITNSTTQTTARTIVDQISQSIQFSGSDVTIVNNGNTVCVGDKQYDAVLYNQLDGSSADHALYVSPRNGTCNPITNFVTGNSDPSKNSRELLGTNMRLSKFSVKPMSDGVYSVGIKIANGDDDLLCNPDSPAGGGDCRVGTNDTTHQNGLKSSAIKCRPITGAQFCSVVELNVSVQKRID